MVSQMRAAIVRVSDISPTEVELRSPRSSRRNTRSLSPLLHSAISNKYSKKSVLIQVKAPMNLWAAGSMADRHPSTRTIYRKTSGV